MWKRLKVSTVAAAVSLACLSGWAQEGPVSTSPSKLRYETLVVDGLTRAGGARLPSGEAIVSSPLTSTLIHGRSDAILIDPPMSIEQTRQVVQWIERSGKELKYVYVTHGHGDHWAGSQQVLDRFPGAVVYATPGTIARMHEQLAPERIKMVERDFPGQTGRLQVLARPMPAGGLDLEGNSILAVDMGHSDSDDSTVLYVPSMQLVAAGDVVYNGVHPLLLEGGNGGLDAWLLALDKVEALRPQTVIASHKNKALADDPTAIAQTRQYILDAKRLLAAKPTPQEYYAAMLELHPDRINPGPLWYSGVGLLTASDTDAGQSQMSRKTGG